MRASALCTRTRVSKQGTAWTMYAFVRVCSALPHNHILQANLSAHQVVKVPIWYSSRARGWPPVTPVCKTSRLPIEWTGHKQIQTVFPQTAKHWGSNLRYRESESGSRSCLPLLPPVSAVRFQIRSGLSRLSPSLVPAVGCQMLWHWLRGRVSPLVFLCPVSML